MNSSTKSPWIRVKETLPEPGEDVLVLFPVGADIAQYWEEGGNAGWTLVNHPQTIQADCDPLYWMPLPEPPNE